MEQLNVQLPSILADSLIREILQNYMRRGQLF